MAQLSIKRDKPVDSRALLIPFFFLFPFSKLWHLCVCALLSVARAVQTRQAFAECVILDQERQRQSLILPGLDRDCHLMRRVSSRTNGLSASGNISLPVDDIIS